MGGMWRRGGFDRFDRRGANLGDERGCNRRREFKWGGVGGGSRSIGLARMRWTSGETV